MRPWTLPLTVGTSKQVQVLLGKSPPAVVADARLIALISFFFSFFTIAFSISLCEKTSHSHYIVLPSVIFADLLKKTHSFF